MMRATMATSAVSSRYSRVFRWHGRFVCLGVSLAGRGGGVEVRYGVEAIFFCCPLCSVFLVGWKGVDGVLNRGLERREVVAGIVLAGLWLIVTGNHSGVRSVFMLEIVRNNLRLARYLKRFREQYGCGSLNQ